MQKIFLQFPHLYGSGHLTGGSGPGLHRYTAVFHKSSHIDGNVNIPVYHTAFRISYVETQQLTPHPEQTKQAFCLLWTAFP